MQESKYILFFLGALGAFNGLMLGLYLLGFAKRKNLSGLFLGCLLVALSLRTGKSVFVYFNPTLPRLYLQIGLSACLLIGPSLLFFIKSSVHQPVSMPRSWRLQFTGLLLVVGIVGIIYPYQAFPKLWNTYLIRIIYGIWMFYIVAAGWQLKEMFSRIGNRAHPLKTAEQWLIAIFMTNAAIFISFLLALIFGNVFQTYYAGAMIFSFVLYIMIFIQLYKGKITGEFYLLPFKSPNKRIKDDNTVALLNSLDQVMNNSEIFKSPNLTLGELAKTINLPAHQFSQLLNDQLGKNFTTYVNEHRIAAACKMIAADHPFSLEAIGYEVGFNSKSTFYTAFKKVQGTTPLLYKESLLKKQKRSKQTLTAYLP